MRATLETSPTVLVKARSASAAVPWLDVGPMLVFFAAFHLARVQDPDSALFVAAGVFAVAALFALLWGLLKDGSLSTVLLVSTAAIVGTAALAGLSGSKLFLFMRPTAINGGLGAVLLIGTAMGAYPARRILGRLYDLPDTAWASLALRWGVFLIGIALANELLWRTQTETVWVNVKTFVFAPLTAIFFLLQGSFIRRAAVAHQG